MDQLIEKNRENGYWIYNIPGILISQKGTALVYYECRHGGDWSVSDIALKISHDGGKSFSQRKTVVSGNGRHTVHAAMMYEKNGALYLLWNEDYHRAYLAKSTDEGETWSAPRDITYVYEELYQKYPWQVVCQGPGHAIVTKSGRVILGVWMANNSGDRNKHFPSAMATVYSDDGEHFMAGEVIFGDEQFFNPSESVIAECSDGSFYLNFRQSSEARYRAVTRSASGIGGWSEKSFDLALPDPECAAGLTVAEEKLVFSNCNHDKSTRDPRKNLTLRISADCGRTWSKGYLVNENAGYSDVAYDSTRKTVVVVYNGGRMEGAEDWWQYQGIRVAVVPIEEIC
ncbi:MAG: exo-alpha-sialidase [Clostridia bacterium]|nr:exo-alpha-sialidase [Clostridia bacterium]